MSWKTLRTAIFGIVLTLGAGSTAGVANADPMEFQAGTKHFKSVVERFGDKLVANFQPFGCVYKDDPTKTDLICLRFGGANDADGTAVMYIVAIHPETKDLYYIIRFWGEGPAGEEIVVFDHNKHGKDM